MPKKILVVEDTAINLKLIKMILTKAGYEVLEASNGKEALRIAKVMTFDLIVSDLKMSGIDAAQFIPILKKDERLMDIPIVVLSSKSLDEVRLDEKYVSAYLGKPIQPEILLKTIEEFLPKTDTDDENLLNKRS